MKLEAKYYKDYRHNYLILCMPEETPDLYQCRMITENQIGGLLECRRKHINGETLLYYDISSRQNMESLYENKTITMKSLKSFFVQLKMTWKGMSKFLLNENRLVLCPEYIFADAETESFSFLYYPFEQEENYLLVFLEFLMERVDKEDREAVEAVYGMYELAEREQFVTDEILAWFEQGCEERQKQHAGTEASPAEADGLQREPVFEQEREEETELQQRGILTEGRKKLALAGLVLTALAGIVLLYLFINYRFAQKEQMYFNAAVLADGAGFVVCGLYLLYERWMPEGLSFLSERKRGGEERKQKGFAPVYQDTAGWGEGEGKEEPAFGNTVFIPWVENCENKLYGMGKGNKNHIDLTQLPLTVGKLAGSVDMVITDPSISRRHAKFAREEGHVYMTDLNSTNGTFKNGFRLEPNMSAMLEPGDEIRLGKLKFIYR